MVVGRPPVAMKSNPYSPPMVGGSPYSPPMVGGMGEVKTSNSPYSQVQIGQEGNPVLVTVEVIITFVFLYQESLGMNQWGINWCKTLIMWKSLDNQGKRECDSDKQFQRKISLQPPSLFSPPSYPLPFSYMKKQVIRQLYPNKILNFAAISIGINWLNSSPCTS